MSHHVQLAPRITASERDYDTVPWTIVNTYPTEAAMNLVTRRDALRLLTVPIGLVALGATPFESPRRTGARATGKLKVLVAGGHPDDPESGCGGTMARYASAGHDVVALYLTRGEAGIAGKSHDESATIRTAEAERACAILGATARFAGQVDGDTHVDADAYASVRDLFARERPD